MHYQVVDTILRCHRMFSNKGWFEFVSIVLIRKWSVLVQVKQRIATPVATVNATVMRGSTVVTAGSGCTPKYSPVSSGTPEEYTPAATVKALPPVTGKMTQVSGMDDTSLPFAILPHTVATTRPRVVASSKLNQVTQGLAHVRFVRNQAVRYVEFEVLNTFGRPYLKKFLNPVARFLSYLQIRPCNGLVEWNQQGTASIVPTPLFRKGQGVWKFHQYPGVAISAPKKGKGATHVFGATSPVTGPPFRREAWAVRALIVASSAWLGGSRRQRLS